MSWIFCEFVFVFAVGIRWICVCMYVLGSCDAEDCILFEDSGYTCLCMYLLLVVVRIAQNLDSQPSCL
jgi:hypothetical protein